MSGFTPPSSVTGVQPPSSSAAINNNPAETALPQPYAEQNQAKGGKSRRPINRWYDQDPLLLETLDLLRSFQEEMKPQAEAFLTELRGQLGDDVTDQLLSGVTPPTNGKRWYDQDPAVYQVVELLRVLPTDQQRQVAQTFLAYLKGR